MHDLHPRGLAVLTKATEVTTKCVEIDFLSDLVRPLLLALQVLTEIIVIDVETDTCIVLTCQASTIYGDRAVLIHFMQ